MNILVWWPPHFRLPQFIVLSTFLKFETESAHTCASSISKKNKFFEQNLTFDDPTTEKPMTEFFTNIEKKNFDSYNFQLCIN